MLTLEEIAERLKDRRLSVVTQITGLHENTIAAIRDGKNTNPTLETLAKLSAYLSVR
jgi:DNA-binding Xre family transcriptional regulator